MGKVETRIQPLTLALSLISPYRSVWDEVDETSNRETNLGFEMKPQVLELQIHAAKTELFQDVGSCHNLAIELYRAACP